MEKGQSIEISQIVRKYESCRIKEKKQEDELLVSIREKGILEPLRGIDTQEGKILLDGFKRLRCAISMKNTIVPYLSIGENEAEGILEFIRKSEAKPLNMFEQIQLIGELKKNWELSISEIAEKINKSVGWVGMRVNLMKELTPNVIDKIMKGSFSAYSYMYYVRPFMRMKEVKKDDIDRFVNALSGKKVTTRDVNMLANAYFTGSKSIREQIEEGNLNWNKKSLKTKKKTTKDEFTQAEQQILNDLELVRRGVRQLAGIDCDMAQKAPAFLIQINLLTEGILKWTEEFNKMVRSLNDQSGKTHGHRSDASTGNKQKGDSQATESK